MNEISESGSYAYTYAQDTLKTRTSIIISKPLLTKAQQYGINLSKTIEKLLSFYIEGIEQIQTKIKNQIKTETLKAKGSAETARFQQWTGRDLNPRPSDCESDVHTKLNHRPLLADV